MRRLRIVAALAAFMLSAVPAGAASWDPETDPSPVEDTSPSALYRPALSIAAGAAASARNAPGAPEWLSRVYAGTEFGEGLEPEFYVETVQPLYQSAGRVDTLFVQPRFSYQEDTRNLYNAGLGWRHYVEGANALAGVNAFGDYQERHSHARLGLGAEWLSPSFDARFNSYLALTPARRVDTLAEGPVYEKAADGVDFEAGVPAPFLEGTRVYAGGRLFFFEEAKNIYAWKTRLEVKPRPWIAVNVHYVDENDAPGEWRADVRASVLFGGPVERRPESAVPDARDRALDRVEREHRIMTEKSGEGLSFLVAKA